MTGTGYTSFTTFFSFYLPTSTLPYHPTTHKPPHTLLTPYRNTHLTPKFLDKTNCSATEGTSRIAARLVGGKQGGDSWGSRAGAGRGAAGRLPVTPVNYAFRNRLHQVQAADAAVPPLVKGGAHLPQSR